MAIEYAEMQGFPEGKWSLGVFEGKRRLKVKWHEAYNLLAALEWTPWPYVDLEFGNGINNCYPYRADIKPFPGGRQLAYGGSFSYYEYALVDVYYTTEGGEYDTTNQWKYSVKCEPYTRMQKIDPNGRLFWDASGNNPVIRNDAPIANFHGIKIKATYSGLTTMPTDMWYLTQCVNYNLVYSRPINTWFPRNTLLFGGSTITLTYQMGYEPRYSVTYESFFWPFEHNKFYHPLGGFQHMYKQGGGIYKLYQPTYFPTDM